MKIIKIALISAGVLIFVLVTGAIIFIKTFDINRFKPQIISQAKSALNRRVDFEKAGLGLSLRQGITLKISGLVIGENPAFGKGDFLTVKNISLGVDVLGYLFQRKVNIPSVVIDSARVMIIREKDGSLNAASFTQPAEGVKNVSAPPAPGAPSPLAMPALFISSLRISNSTATYIDHSFEPALSIEISDLNVSVSKVSLTGPFPFTLEASVLSAGKNLRLEGKAAINLKTEELTLSELQGSAELADIVLEKIPVYFPMTKGAVLPASLKGKLNFSLDNMTVGPKGLSDLTAGLSLANGSAQFKEIASPVKDVVMNANITGKKVSIDKFSAAIGEGSIKGSGQIDDYLSKQDYSIAAELNNLKIQDLILPDKAPVKIEGIVSGPLKCKGQGLTSQDMNKLSGEAEISITKAKLKDINVLRIVLDKISVIPGLSQKIEAGLPEKFQQKLSQKDTVLSDMKLPATIENGNVVVKDAVFSADEFMIKGQVQGSFDGSYSLEGSFLIPRELSAAIVDSVSDMQYLLNEDKEIYIPIKVSGKAPKFKLKVDAKYIGNKLFTNQAEQQLLKAIDKAVGGKDQSATDQNTPQSGASEKSSIESSVSDILQSILKKKQK